MNERLLLILCLFVSLCSIARTEAHRTPAPPTWQRSEKASALLGVRDKYSQLGSYEATFTVTTPLGEKFQKSITVKSDEWGEVTFPDDFDLPPAYPTKQRPGRFRWACVVRGEEVVRGEFEIATGFDFDPSVSGKGEKP